MTKVISSFFVAFLFLFMQGCATKTPAPQINTKNVSNEKASTDSKLTPLVGKNYIKGVIISLKHANDGQGWNYEIDGIETTNGKLPRVNFNHKSVLANEGDLVYASFDGMRVSEMFVIKAAYFKNGKITPSPVYTKKKPTTEPASAGKRDKAHQVLSVPKEETIKLN
ncbi:hypothetical protein [Sulfurospirillum barnesii]|uniref:Uncharacterized protein n=1 Tax=Sulfurospirillum barnesii (strain ATCC 700032 / DSM 10660 / SES-3) TaxID=760154 RepID=I3XV52_SULBS|nr:hypothetical protein [Sulfurospirillum barnesii]AFL67826.1 hypothetical protein Sulba_0509 [Sulfurospirillum barnesii SES-3]